MKDFKVLSSILEPQQLNRFLQTKYNLSTNATCSILKTGINHTYLVKDDTKKYVFRIYSYNWRTKEEIQEELNFITLLKKNNIAVSYPILDNSNKYIQEVNAPEGLRYGVLSSYAEGDKVRMLTEQDCYQMGLLLAQCHKASQNKTLNRVDYNIKTLTKQPYQYALKYYEPSLDEMQFVNNAITYLETKFSTEQTNKLQHGIIHLDFWYDNMNITKDSKITVFDFDFCGNGWLILDVAYCTMQLFNTEPDKKAYEKKVNSLYQGYESILPLSKEEKELIPAAALATWIFYLGVQSQRFNDWSNLFLTKNYLTHYISLVKTWLSHNNVKL